MSLSLAFTYLNHWHWHFVNPTGWFGAAAWTAQGNLVGLSLPGMLWPRTLSIAHNFGQTGTALASHAASGSLAGGRRLVYGPLLVASLQSAKSELLRRPFDLPQKSNHVEPVADMLGADAGALAAI